MIRKWLVSFTLNDVGDDGNGQEYFLNQMEIRNIIATIRPDAGVELINLVVTEIKET